jgi:hypothetical protein
VQLRALIFAPAACWALIACGGRSAHISQPARAAQPTATLALRTALVAPATVMSCRGDVYCREDTVTASGQDDALDEAREDCARRGGQASASACPRSEVVASCSLGSESGTIAVFTYAQANEAAQGEVVHDMSARCEDLGGSFELASR